MFGLNFLGSVSKTTTHRKPLFSYRGASKVAGYFGGGDTGVYQSNIDKIAFPADTKTTLSATLTSARRDLAGMANISVAGYFGGGYTSSAQSNIDKITFPADTRTTLSATLTSGRYLLAGMVSAGNVILSMPLRALP